MPYDTPIPGYRNEHRQHAAPVVGQGDGRVRPALLQRRRLPAGRRGQGARRRTSPRSSTPTTTSSRARSCGSSRSTSSSRATLQDIVRRYKKRAGWSATRGRSIFARFADRSAIQLNDTHPALAIPELMRMLVDDEQLDWDDGLGHHAPRPSATPTTRSCPRRSSAGPSPCFDRVLPRHLQIIYEINQRFLAAGARAFRGDDDALPRACRSSRRATPSSACAWRTSRSSAATRVNGVAALHTRDPEARRSSRLRRDVPGAVQQQDQRHHAAPLAAEGATRPCPTLITERIGDGWVTDLDELRKLLPLADDAAFRDGVARGQARATRSGWPT